MLDDFFVRARVRARIRQNPCGRVLEPFVEYLNARGYSRNTVHLYLFAAEHFGKWLGRRKITRAAVTAFVQFHLPKCRCKTPAQQKSATVCAALNRLLDMAGADSVVSRKLSASASILRRYSEHLTQVQGLAPVTVHYRQRYAREMLTHFGIKNVRQLKRLTVGQVRQFVTNQGLRCQPNSGQVMASSLRSFLRFLLLQEWIARDLAAAVPSFANWRLATLPTTVSNQQLRKLVRVIDPSSPNSRRDLAIMLSLVELGLRASDVAGLQLDGLGVTERVVRLRRPKQRELTDVVVSPRLATAIDEYVQRERPACTTSALFVSLRAPRGQAMTPMGIRGVIRRCAEAAGLTDHVSGSNVIRHSVASRWIQAGATLKQIADLLGHRSINTTSIYAKVDLRALKRVALPWPGDCEVTS